MDTKRTPFGDAAVISVDAFVNKLLPPLHSHIPLDALFSDAKMSANSLPVTKRGYLHGYATKHKPSKITSAFKPLQMCARKIAKAFAPLESTLVFKNNEDAQWLLRDRTEDSLPDAYFLSKSGRDDRVDWTTIAVPGVYNKIDTATLSDHNVTKITRCMFQCLHRDARRRFVYGFTVDDSRMRLWFCDRSQIVVSDPFLFVTGWKPFFQFWVRIMYADPRDLGFDPTVRLLEDDASEPRYEIEVGSPGEEVQVYRTLDALSQGGQGIVGGATRVWKAVKVENGEEVGEAVALKDSWVWEDGNREGLVDASIRASCASDEQKAALDKSFLTVLAHGDILVDGAADRTRAAVTPGKATGKAPDHSERDPYTQPHDRSRIHYRIVYKEVCKPLRSTSSLYTVFKTLSDACHGLEALYKCGWVHRDISVGNLLLFGDRAKIHGLEYAERVDDIAKRPHAVVGTYGFVAVEAQQGRYIFLPRRLNRGKRSGEGPQASQKDKPTDKRVTRAKRKTPSSPRDESPPPQLPDFHYNALHDLQSLWWIAAYYLIAHEVDSDEDLDEEASHNCSSQLITARKLFLDGSARDDAISGMFSFRIQLECLAPTLRDVGSRVEDARARLMTAYQDAERELHADGLRIKNPIHPILSNCFHEIAETLKDHDILVRPLDAIADRCGVHLS
ncbi:hypothetical protein NM688_g4317 [Phlebia brevispora]|uniref:Uncharacterized protein n=1 Tax=Phlebia brevispora TaxID=194682 RepID=A0ACC1T3M9_9APHY|nr:hypothetical protein NM688_g4317 [Phlebia brevispora]